MNPNDPHDLQRFIDAQEPVFGQACTELAAGAKTSHWMWFVFPQLKGLGHSALAQRYGIASREEALAYWHHPVLGPRLKACCELMLRAQGLSAHQILGSPDDLKLRSSMTLFDAVAGDEEPVFARVLSRYYGGERDARTMDRL